MLIAFGRGGARRSDVARVVGKRCVGEVNRYTAKDYYGKQLEEKWSREVRAANDVTGRAMSVAEYAERAGATVVIENPVCRGEGLPFEEPWSRDERQHHRPPHRLGREFRFAPGNDFVS